MKARRKSQDNLEDDHSENQEIEESFIEIDSEKVNQDNSKEKKISCKERCKKCLRLMSLGKYPTQLFFKKSESYSSIIGGLISILFIAFMTYLTVSIALEIFEKNRYILDQITTKF